MEYLIVHAISHPFSPFLPNLAKFGSELLLLQTPYYDIKSDGQIYLYIAIGRNASLRDLSNSKLRYIRPLLHGFIPWRAVRAIRCGHSKHI